MIQEDKFWVANEIPFDEIEIALPEDDPYEIMSEDTRPVLLLKRLLLKDYLVDGFTQE